MFLKSLFGTWRMLSNKTSKKDAFHFNTFSIQQDRCAMKVGTDAVLLAAWAPLPLPCNRILDIGTGTGVLSLLLAQRSPASSVVGVEIDPEAAAQAAENVAASPYSERVRIQAQPIQDFKDAPAAFDLIISNPPFFTGGVLSEALDRQTARHTLRLPHQDLLRSVQHFLSPSGYFCLILPKIEGLRFMEIAVSMQLYPFQQLWMRARADQPIHRLCIAFSRQPNRPLQSTEITQYEEKSQAITPAFAALVKPYFRPALSTDA